MEKHESQIAERWLKLADKLDELQAPKNNGRGVSHIKTIVAFLRSSMIDKAKAICYNEGDKMRSYPDILEVIEIELLEDKLFKPLKFTEDD